MKTRVLNIIIDADIARSSGESIHPISSSARAILEGVRNNKHNIVMCPLLSSEWKKHKSLFSARWLSSMIAKKQFQRINPNSDTKYYIEQNISDEKIKSISIKDAHLIDGALNESKIIASNDDKARNAFISISSDYKCINEIVWFNSVKDKVFIENYLKSSNFIPSKYYLR